MGGDSAVSSVWAERGRKARSWRTCEMPPRTWSLGMGCLSVCVKFQVLNFKLNLTKRESNRREPNRKYARAARCAFTCDVRQYGRGGHGQLAACAALGYPSE